MSGVVKELRGLIETHGRPLCEDLPRLERMLSELATASKRDINVLTAAAEAGVPGAILADASARARADLRRKLVAEQALIEPAARWAVDAWACALGVLPVGKVRPLRAGGRTARAAWWRRNRLAFAALLLVLLAAVGLWGYMRFLAPATLRGHTAEVDCVAFSADGLLAVSAGQDNAVLVWDLADTREIRRLELDSPAHQVASSPDGRRVLVCRGPQAELWDLRRDQSSQVPREAWARRAPASAAHTPATAAFSPDGRIALVGWAAAGRFEAVPLDGKRSRVFLWPAEGQSKGIAAFRPGRRQVAFAGGAGAPTRLWDLDAGCEIRRFEVHTPGVSCLAFSPDGERLATGDLGGVVRLWSAASGRGRLAFDDHRLPVLCVAFGPGGERLFSADARYLAVRDASDGKRIGRYDLARALRLGRKTRIRSLAMSARSGRLLAGCDDGVIRLWPVPGLATD